MSTKTALDAFFGPSNTVAPTSNVLEKNPVENSAEITSNSNSKQGWSRDKYNAYQREYMKVWRAVKAGKAEVIKG